MKITSELIQRMELDPEDEWCTDPEDGTINVGIVGIEQDIRDYFNMQSDDYPDGYTNSYAIINPHLKECVELEISVWDGFDGRDDKGETVKVPARIRKKIVKQLCNDKLLGDELTAWIESFEEDES